MARREAWVIKDGRVEVCRARDPRKCRYHRDKNGTPIFHWDSKPAAEEWLEMRAHLDDRSPTISEVLSKAGPGQQEVRASCKRIGIKLENLVKRHAKSHKPLIFEPVWSPFEGSPVHRPEWWSDARSIAASRKELDGMGLYAGGLDTIAEWSEGIGEDDEIMHRVVLLGLYDAVRNGSVSWGDLRKEGARSFYASAWTAHLTLPASLRAGALAGRKNDSITGVMRSSVAWVGARPKVHAVMDKKHPEWVVSSSASRPASKNAGTDDIIDDSNGDNVSINGDNAGDNVEDTDGSTTAVMSLSDSGVETRGSSSRTLKGVLSDVEALSAVLRLDPTCRLKIVIVT